MLGVGGAVGSTGGFAATARAWHKNRVGIQVSFGRDTMTSDVAAGRVTALQVEPAFLFALFDHVMTSGSVPTWIGCQPPSPESTQSDGASQASHNGVGYRLFAGSELTFASMQRFGLSVEFGYRDVPAPFQGFEAGKVSGALVGHWYVK